MSDEEMVVETVKLDGGNLDKLVSLIIGNLFENPTNKGSIQKGLVTTALLQQVEFFERHEYPELSRGEVEKRIRFAILQYHNQ